MNIFLIYAAFGLAPIIGYLASLKKLSLESHMKSVLVVVLITLVYSILWAALEVPLRSMAGAVPPNPETVMDFLGLGLTGMGGAILYIVFAMLSSVMLYAVGAVTGMLQNAIEPSLK